MVSRRREDGAAAVEFGLVLPVLALLMLGIMELGYAFFIQASVAGAARVGVRNYAIHYSDTTTYADDAAAQAGSTAIAKSALLNTSAFGSATFTPACSVGQQTTLTLTYNYQSLTGLFDGLLGKTITITGKGSMQCGG